MHGQLLPVWVDDPDLIRGVSLPVEVDMCPCITGCPRCCPEDWPHWRGPINPNKELP